MGVYYGSNNQYFSYGGFIKRNPTINIEKHGGFIIKKINYPSKHRHDISQFSIKPVFPQFICTNIP